MNHKPKKKMKRFVATSLVVLCCAALSAPVSAQVNLLVNGGFETPSAGLTAPNYLNSITGYGAADFASAANWGLYNNVNTTTTTELLPNTAPGGSGNMLHLTTGGMYSGLYQIFSAVPQATLAVDVYVLSGRAWLALYTNGGGTQLASANEHHQRSMGNADHLADRR